MLAEMAFSGVLQVPEASVRVVVLPRWTLVDAEPGDPATLTVTCGELTAGDVHAAINGRLADGPVTNLLLMWPEEAVDDLAPVLKRFRDQNRTIRDARVLVVTASARLAKAWRRPLAGRSGTGTTGAVWPEPINLLGGVDVSLVRSWQDVPMFAAAWMDRMHQPERDTLATRWTLETREQLIDDLGAGLGPARTAIARSAKAALVGELARDRHQPTAVSSLARTAGLDRRSVERLLDDARDRLQLWSLPLLDGDLQPKKGRELRHLTWLPRTLHDRDHVAALVSFAVLRRHFRSRIELVGDQHDVAACLPATEQIDLVVPRWDLALIVDLTDTVDRRRTRALERLPMSHKVVVTSHRTGQVDGLTMIPAAVLLALLDSATFDVEEGNRTSIDR